MKKYGETGATKTRSSTRYIDLLPLAEETLKEYFKVNKQYNQKNIFLSQYNTPFRDYTAPSTAFKKLVEKCNIKNGTLYNLRHTFASNMISKGADILWVSKTLGHENLKITLDTYAKFMRVEESQRLENIKKYGTYLAHQ